MNQISEIKISYKDRTSISKSKKINSSINTSELLFNTWDQETIELLESFKVVLLNNSNRVKGICEISTGGITGTLVDIRIIMALALKSLSTTIIIAHNHPSGTLKPSSADRRLTKKIKLACELFDIKLLDHIILAPNGKHFSFADSNLI